MNRKLTALVIGISKYPNGAALKNPVNDAEDVTTALSDLGFSVIKLLDASSEDIDRAMESFRDNLNSNDIGLFYFAGHGMQIKGENYLNTVNTAFIDEISAKHSSYPLNQVIDIMDSCSNITNIMILDACRNNPFVRAWNRDPGQSGLASVYTPRGTLIAFATSPGEVAKDGKGRNGSYTESLLKHIKTHDVPIEDLFKRVRNTLSFITSGEQTSWEHTSLSGDFYFNISVGRSIAIYSQEAVADSTFLLQAHEPAHYVISALKVCNWYTQNPALENFPTDMLSDSDNDTLFVFGRNVYQAACGSANSATEFILNYRTKVSGIASNKAKSILDGMLFEMFFNSKGELRKSFKLSKFNELFKLKNFAELSESFEFISEVLLNYQHRFYVIPGKSRNISVDVSSSKNEDGENVIDAVYFEGVNILKESDDVSGFSDTGYYPIRIESVKKLISSQMVIPYGQLSVTTPFDDVHDVKILFPHNKTLCK
jgi:hypothetical protein